MKGKLYTSYFPIVKKGKGIKISIARFNPPWLDIKAYNMIWLPHLAPSEDLLDRHLKGNVFWDDFTKEYLKGLNTVEAEDNMFYLMYLLRRGYDVTVYCHEGKSRNCHRHVLGDIVRSKGYEVKEL